MSLDVYIKVNVCPACGRCDAGDSMNFNFTYNYQPMLLAAARSAGLTAKQYKGHTLGGIEGPAGRYVERLERIIGALEAEPEKYIAMNPANGWGSYDLLLPRLREMLAVMKKNPNVIVETSR